MSYFNQSYEINSRKNVLVEHVLARVLDYQKHCITFFQICFNYFRFYIVKYDPEYPTRNFDFVENDL